jgi:hypothetical protein
LVECNIDTGLANYNEIYIYGNFFKNK